MMERRPANQGDELDPDRLLATRMHPSWACIRPIVEFVQLSTENRASSETTARIALVLRELLENAVKYGGLGEDILLTIRLRPFSSFEVQVSNRAVASRASILSREVARLTEGRSVDAFAEALKRSSTLPKGASMIGLSRIVHEGGVTLDAQVQGDRVTVTAKGSR